MGGFSAVMASKSACVGTAASTSKAMSRTTGGNFDGAANLGNGTA